MLMPMSGRLSLRSMDRQDFDRIRSLVQGNILFDLDPQTDGPAHIEIGALMFPDLLVTDVALDNVMATRRPDHIAADGNDDVTLNIPLQGSGLMTFPQRTGPSGAFALEPDGRALVMTNDEPYRGTCSHVRSIVISMPQAVLAPLSLDLDRLRAEGVARTAAVTLLADYAQLVCRQVDALAPNLSRLASANMQSMLRMILQDAETPEVDTARQNIRLDTIKEDIRANLSFPMLTLDWLAPRHNLKPRQIQNLFYGQGESFSRFVLLARLDMARRILESQFAETRSISEVALSSGFNDISYFNNSFKKLYGHTPKRVRELAVARRSALHATDEPEQEAE
ncbi:hypothetical protein ATO6_14840 [Oceanicola sp. 22II-s10i]|uniref:AraC family transcriptional regulator n=1 Tax=Oceanicola sp. 22II-s10i TaxID=1317116 RepID=UPI000B521420|nr:AraC family transcriptional regulator [Oceanicola sp. 22II-s10i]OWU84296.1 hypothetical protein ATO6_14840 [Oceanicola sp. 22II-s10i]